MNVDSSYSRSESSSESEVKVVAEVLLATAARVKAAKVLAVEASEVVGCEEEGGRTNIVAVAVGVEAVAMVVASTVWM